MKKKILISPSAVTTSWNIHSNRDVMKLNSVYFSERYDGEWGEFVDRRERQRLKQHMLDVALPFKGQEAQRSLNMNSCC